MLIYLIFYAQKPICLNIDDQHGLLSDEKWIRLSLA